MASDYQGHTVSHGYSIEIRNAPGRAPARAAAGTAGSLASLWLAASLVLSPALAGANGDTGGAGQDPPAIVVGLAALPARPSVESARQTPAEPELRLAVQAALWPPEIARLATDYLARFPRHEFAADAAELQRRARLTSAVLQRTDVQLFRSAFDVPPTNAQAKLRQQAALGDPVAAFGLAQQAPAHADSSRRRLGWLQYASHLGSAPAAYALALHYRREDQPLLAAQYEARALELGYAPPPALDHRR